MHFAIILIARSPPIALGVRGQCQCTQPQTQTIVSPGTDSTYNECNLDCGYRVNCIYTTEL